MGQMFILYLGSPDNNLFKPKSLIKVIQKTIPSLGSVPHMLSHLDLIDESLCLFLTGLFLAPVPKKRTRAHALAGSPLRTKSLAPFAM